MNNEIRNRLSSRVGSITRKISSVREKYPDARLRIKIAQGMSKTACKVLRQYLNFEPPSDCFEWLTIFNGIEGSYIKTLYDHNAIMEILAVYEEWKEFQYFPLAGDGCGGEYLVIPFKKDNETYFPVVFVECDQPDKELGKYTYIASSSIPIFLEIFLREILYDLEMLFDEGYVNKDDVPPDFWWPYDKDLVLQNDPDIVSFNIRLPWEEEE